jgi:hypothetical protein
VEESVRRNDLAGGLFFLVGGLLFALYARSVDVGTWDEPGPGFLPFWAGSLLIGMSALLIAKTLLRRHREDAGPFFPELDSWKRVLMTIGALVAYNLLLQLLGFVLVTFFFVGFLVKCIFPQGWVKSIVTAALSTAFARLVFVNLLEIHFPKGLLGL